MLRAAAWLWLAALWLLALPAPVAAATYAFRSDTYAWESTSTTIAWDRTCTGYPGDDDKATITFSGNFRFPFGGTNYTSVLVLANGMLQFGGDTGFHRVFGNGPLPTSSVSSRSGCVGSAPSRLIIPYWTDLNPSASGSGGVTWQQKGSAPNRYVVVSWNAVYQYGTATPYTFQVILYENGEFKFQYGNDNASGSNATIGVQVSSSDYTQYAYNSGYNANGTAIRWFQPSGAATKVAEYRFDEYGYSGALGEVKDSSGNEQHGQRVGSAASSAGGYICRGVDIPANTSTAANAVDTGVDVDSRLGNEGSLSFWYLANNAWGTAADGQLFDATTVSGRSFHLVRRNGGSLRFAVSDSAGATIVADSSAQSFAAGNWVHIAVTWRLANGSNQSVARIYVNGSLAGSKTGTTNGVLDPSLGTLYLGDNRNGITSNNATVNSAAGRFDEFNVYNYEISLLDIAADRIATHSCPPPLHHMEVRHSGGIGVSCLPNTVTVAACSDAACSTTYTGGMTGRLTVSGSSNVVFPLGADFTILPGSSTASVSFQVTSAANVVLGTTNLSPAAANTTTCNFGNPSCTFSVADAGFVFDVPDHLADSSNAVTMRAVKKDDSSNSCVAAFTSVTKDVNFRCTYSNPGSGTLPVRVNGSSANASGSAAAACDAGGRTLALLFGPLGTTVLGVQYADVGQATLTATYTGSGPDAGLTLQGIDAFVAAPASFGFSAITAAPIRAGMPFSATVTARNSSGNATPNFGRESPAEGVTLSFTKRQPTGGASSNGLFAGSLGAFSAGVATASNLTWSEVGTGDLNVTLTGPGYLGTSYKPTGTTGTAGAVGRFIPHHFDTTATAACGSFSYAGQPFEVTVTARNASGGVTVNYDGAGVMSPSFAKAVTLAEATALGVGSFGNGSIAASAFAAGVASATPSYAFTSKTTGPQTLGVRATDTDAVSSAGHTEGSMALRSGRLRLANAFGAETRTLNLAVAADYWSGNSWLPNGDDSCTTVPAAAVVKSNQRDRNGSATSAWSTTASGVTLSAGQGAITLSAPGTGDTGSIDLALNLGSTTTDQSCLASHPASTGAGLAWLRSRNGSCATTWDRDPAARASFGIYAPETRKTVHVRDIF